MQKRIHSFQSLVLVSAMLIVAVMAGCKKDDTKANPVSGGSNNNPTTVSMQNTAFSPSTLTVAAGTTVTWTNDDNMTHTVTSGVPGAPDGKFDSGNLTVGKTFQFTFTAKGTYPYYCIIHANTMKATVVVQ